MYEKGDAIYFKMGDDVRLEQFVLELRAIFDDVFVDSKQHTAALIARYRSSKANFYGIPSRHGVEQIKAVVSAALERVKRYPQALKTMAAKAPKHQDAIV
jgi:hypothetical protein